MAAADRAPRRRSSWTPEPIAATSLVPGLASWLRRRHRCSLGARRPLLFGLIGAALVLLVAEEPHRPSLDGAGDVAVGQHPRLVPAGRWSSGHLAGSARLERTDRPHRPRAGRAGRRRRRPGGACRTRSGPRILVLSRSQLLGRSETLSKIIEWQSPDFDDLRPATVPRSLAGCDRPSRASPTGPQRPADGGVGRRAAALMALRNLPVAALILVPAARPRLSRSRDHPRRQPLAAVRVGGRRAWSAVRGARAAQQPARPRTPCGLPGRAVGLARGPGPGRRSPAGHR